jgi:hypothetical protein
MQIVVSECSNKSEQHCSTAETPWKCPVPDKNIPKSKIQEKRHRFKLVIHSS